MSVQVEVPRSQAVHPHVCGEHAEPPHRRVPSLGSSPRVWGTCGRRSRMPAYNGSSPRVWGTCDRRGRRGGHGRFIPTCVGNMIVPQAGIDQHRRFIPTCVGNIYPSTSSLRRTSVHPHVCGEHLMFSTAVLNHSGSSPRVWGTFRHTLDQISR